MISYDKQQIKEQLDINDYYNLLVEWGGEPEYTSLGLISRTICHNKPNEGSKKLYFYENSRLFKCYTGCEDSIFDIYELVRKIAYIQWNKTYDLNDAVRWIAKKFNIDGELVQEEEEELIDWKYFTNYERITEINNSNQKEEIILKEYSDEILDRLSYNIKIAPWLREGITQDVLTKAKIGYYLGNDQITIPHYDINNRFIGLRGRTVCGEDAELYGKYRPLKINGIQYSHPLGMNLYGLNWSKDNIKLMKKAIIFESEKSTLKFASMFGWENNISVACCGSNISSYQIQLLLEAGAQEIIIAFDRQFQKIGDNEFKRLKANLLKIREKYKNYAIISFIFDKKMLTGYKDSPIDSTREIFLNLLNERIVI